MKPLYFVESYFPRLRQRAFIECDRDSNSREYVKGLIRTGEVTPLKVLEVDEEQGTCRDVTAEILEECNYSQAAE